MERVNRKISTVLFGLLTAGFIVLNFVLINGGDFGIFLTFDNDTHFNTQFLSELFMKPYFHFPCYLWGVILCYAFIRYAREKTGLIPAEVANNSLTSRLFAFIRANYKVRYPLYLIGLTLTSVTYFTQQIYTKDNSAWGKGAQAAYGSMAYPGFVLGLSIFVISGLVGRAEFIRFFLGGDAWILFKNIGYGLYMFSPVYSLLYFLSMSVSQHLDYQMMFYNFCGIFIFSLLLVQIFYTFIHGPFSAIFELGHDLNVTTNAINLHLESAFNIEHYKLKNEGTSENEPLLVTPRSELSPATNGFNNINQT
jgi:hypothetical protein